MISRFLMVIAAIVLLATNADAMTLEGQCQFQFFSKSTLHKFDGKGACQPFTMISEQTVQGEELIRTPEIDVLVKGMDSDNAGRDEKMYDMFESDQYPVIKSMFKDLDPEVVLQQLSDKGNIPGHLDFDLQIRDITRPVQASVRKLLVTPEEVSFEMEFNISLADYDLKPPSLLGVIRVDDQVRVDVMVSLTRH